MGESEKISTRSGVLFSFCFAHILECIVMYFPSLIKLVMAFILHVIFSRIYGIEGSFFSCLNCQYDLYTCDVGGID